MPCRSGWPSGVRRPTEVFAAPVGVFVAAVLVGRWQRLLWVVGLAVLLTLPYLIHLAWHSGWYLGQIR